MIRRKDTTANVTIYNIITSQLQRARADGSHVDATTRDNFYYFCSVDGSGTLDITRENSDAPDIEKFETNKNLK